MERFRGDHPNRSGPRLPYSKIPKGRKLEICFIEWAVVHQWILPICLKMDPKLCGTAIWIRLPEVPTEFYDHHILARVGQSMGKLVKTGICTSQTLRG